LVDGLVAATDQVPILTSNTPGVHTVKLVVKSIYGCESDTATKIFIVNPAPVVSITAQSGCINELLNFSGNQLDNATTITQWNWNFGNGVTSNLQNPVFSSTSAGNITATLYAVGSNGCISADATTNINIAYIDVTTIRDTTVLPNIPFPLSTSWLTNSALQVSFSWTPATGLNNPFISVPIASLQNDQTYIITATTQEGCVANDTVNIKVFKGSAVYVPTGFTPNGDGRNDFLRGLYIGITKVYYFKIYNRWGQLIFSTNSLIEGWDGTIKGMKQPTGSYVWMLRAEDLAGKVYEMKGTSTLIR
jgi:gliding motility-associated-like protein